MATPQPERARQGLRSSIPWNRPDLSSDLRSAITVRRDGPAVVLYLQARHSRISVRRKTVGNQFIANCHQVVFWYSII
jgi:hypothetical protein